MPASRGVGVAVVGRQQPFPELGELRHRLGGGRDVVDLDAGHAQADQGTRGRDPVVVVCVPQTAVQRARRDPDAVGQFLGLAAEGAEVADEGVDAVRLVPADVSDAVQRRRGVGERREGEQRRGCLLYTSDAADE